MRIVKAQLAKFDNTRIYNHHKSTKKGGEIDGRYIRIGGLFKLGAPTLIPVQFLGVHDCLCITMTYPDYIHDILGITADLPSLMEGRPTNWVNAIKASIKRDSLWYFIPKGIWGFIEGDYNRVIKTYSTVSVVAGEGGSYYHILSLPLITRKFLRLRYRGTKTERKPK